MKKLFTLFVLIFCLLINSVVHANNEAYGLSSTEKIEELKKLEIIHCYEDGNFYPEKNITRAEFCKMISVMLGWKDDNIDENTFSDVSVEHWANKYIKFCYDKGLVDGINPEAKIYFVDVDENGNETGITEIRRIEELAKAYGDNSSMYENKFAPDENIIYRDALKILVNALGYEAFAEEFGGYPGGYTFAADAIGIVSDNSYSGTEFLTREVAACIIYNSLSIPIMTEKYIDDENGARKEYVVADGKNGTELITLRKIMSEANN